MTDDSQSGQTPPTEPLSAQVVVVGAGPVGLAAAMALRSRGLDVLLLEAEPEDRVRAGSRAIFIHREPLDHLDAFYPGLSRQILDNGLIWEARRYTYRGEEFHRHRYRPASNGKLRYATSQPQQEVECVLMHAAKDLGVRFRWNCPVASLQPTDTGVRLQTEDGTEVWASYVVGADGARSTVRKSLGIPLEGSSSDACFIVVDLSELADHPLSVELSFHYEHPALGGRNLLMVPMKGAWRVDLQCLPDDDVEYLSSLEGIRDWLPKVMPERYAEGIRWVSQYRFRQLVAARFTDATRRILLAGEAAHLFAPWGGRGLNSGLIDAANAATAIADAVAAGTELAARAAINRFAADRFEAAQYNVGRAAFGLRLLAPTRLRDKLMRRAAGLVAPFVPKAALWLASGPNGGIGEGRPGKTSY